ncbi:MAG: iron-containing alcohol dehydrogenase [Rhodospirillaceae bacterium]|jgi:alcohol dehydrogenase class IV|nr:iron-containing alcohol dehydrogenase [Rhodospirillaceae bacterium]MBT6404677.1 iron-containing alcohol dehydrogenase [Rhodospirillaceae bacterium]MBT6535574.1 iron-containing alcohol dehydrogenase [Rhodospirillaceae bacterium]
MTVEPAALRGTWSFPTTIWFGAGKVTMLARACKTLGMTRPLFVTDPGLAGLEMVASALAQAAADGATPTLFSDIKPNPVSANITAGVAAMHTSDCDGVIAFGGGSSLDAGKTIALMAAQPEDGVDLWDFEEGRKDWQGAVPPLPIVAVPTTAGTGSETGRSTVVLNEATDRKVIITHPGMMPGIVIADPELTLGLPAHITAATGMDALAHCLEAYCSPFDNPLCDGIALEGMRLARENLATAVADGTNIAARSNMLAAAAMGSTAFQKGLGAIHAMSHPIGALYDTHHGLTNAVVMPYVLNRNRSAIEARLARVSAYLGLTHQADDVAAGFDSFFDWTLTLRSKFAMPHTLSELGVEQSRFDDLAEMAAADPTALANPVALDAGAFRKLFETAYTGTLG